MVDDDVSEVIDVLVSDGTVMRKEVKRDDGETAVYYRLAE